MDYLSYAAGYLERGWQPIPVHYAVDGVCSCSRRGRCNTPGKHPVPMGWQEAKFNIEQLKDWWSKNEHYNLGLVTGPRTNLAAMDIDAAANGYESLKKLEEQFGSLPTTITSATGGGGKHFLFQFPNDVVIPTRGSVCAGIDVRGLGGQIVAPPSYHDRGRKRYKWETGRSPGECELATMPEWLRDLLALKESEWIETVPTVSATGIIENGRNNAMFSLGRRLRYINDISPEELGEMLDILNQSKCKPPLEAEEMAHITANVLRKKGTQTILTPEVAKPFKVEVLDTKVLLSEEVKPLDYLIPNMLIRGEVSLLAAPTEAGKSLINMGMALAIACGVPALGRGERATMGKVVYCTEELARRTLQMRLQKLTAGLGVDKDLVSDNFLIIPQQGLSLALKNERSVAVFHETILKIQPAYVVLDTFVAYNSEGEKDPDKSRDWFNIVVLPLRNALNCAFTVQHHTKKPQQENGKKVPYNTMEDTDLNHNIRGTSDLPGVSERIWFLWRQKEERTDWGPKLSLMLRNTKAREGDKHDPMHIQVSDTDKDTTVIHSTVGEKSARFKEIEIALKKALPKGERQLRSKLAATMVGTGLNRGTVYRWIDKYLDTRILLSEGDGDAKVVWLNPNDTLL